MEPVDERGLQSVFGAAEDYFVALTGSQALPGDVQSLFFVAPEGVSPADKLLLVVEHHGAVVGVVDAVPGHPEPDDWAIGLFLIAPAHRRTGVGSAVARALIDHARERGISRVTAATPSGWAPGAAFLAHLGFALGELADSVAGNANRNNLATEQLTVSASLTLTS